MPEEGWDCRLSLYNPDAVPGRGDFGYVEVIIAMVVDNGNGSYEVAIVRSGDAVVPKMPNASTALTLWPSAMLPAVRTCEARPTGPGGRYAR